MGDISEIRGLIVVVSFLGCLVILISLIPSGFFTSGEMREVEPPAQFEGLDIYSFADTSNLYMNETGGWYYPLDANWYIRPIDDGDGDFGGWWLDMWYLKANLTNHEVRHEHVYTFLIFTFSHFMDHYDKNGVKKGTQISVADMEANREDDNATSIFTIKCVDFSAKVIFNYNGTKFNNFTHAWDFHELAVFHGIYFEDINTSFNAFDLIAKLLFFQLPAMNPIINSLIAIPLWVCIAYLVYVLIIKVIPLIAGG